MPVGASAVSRSDWSAPFPSPSTLRTRKSLIIKATIISNDPPRSAPLGILPSISGVKWIRHVRHLTHERRNGLNSRRWPHGFSSTSACFSLFFLRVSFFVHHDFFFMFAISSVIRQSRTLGYAISNFKLRFVPRELSNVVVDAPSSSVSLLASGRENCLSALAVAKWWI